MESLGRMGVRGDMATSVPLLGEITENNSAS